MAAWKQQNSDGVNDCFILKNHKRPTYLAGRMNRKKRNPRGKKDK